MILRNKKYTGTVIKSAQVVSDIFAAILRRKPKFERSKEHLWTIGLDRRNRIVYIDQISIGGLHGVAAVPREIFRMAIHKGLSGLILVHNHCSQVAEPSEQDKSLTLRVREGGQILGVELLDHVIVTEDVKEFYSFRDRDWKEAGM